MDELVFTKVRLAKKKGKVVGLVQGSWDLFHIGHLKYLLEAKKLCDFLVIGMDNDEKIRRRKGENRPIIPEEERYEFLSLLGIADCIVIKKANEPKWSLIKSIQPDVLIAIKENYTDYQLELLRKYCGEIAILPRQAATSTSDKIREITINRQIGRNKNETSSKKGDETWRVSSLNAPLPQLLEELHNSTDPIRPVAAACCIDGEWFFGSNQIDSTLDETEMTTRSELFYNTVEHAEINLLKKLKYGACHKNTLFFVTLFPCEKCMKVLADKGIKKVLYLSDHEDRNWSKRSHEIAKKNGIQTIRLLPIPADNA